MTLAIIWILLCVTFFVVLVTTILHDEHSGSGMSNRTKAFLWLTGLLAIPAIIIATLANLMADMVFGYALLMGFGVSFVGMLLIGLIAWMTEAASSNTGTSSASSTSHTSHTSHTTNTHGANNPAFGMHNSASWQQQHSQQIAKLNKIRDDKKLIPKKEKKEEAPPPPKPPKKTKADLAREAEERAAIERAMEYHKKAQAVTKTQI